MDRPSLEVNDPNFGDRIRQLLDLEQSDHESDDDSEVDDSDADPDYILSDEEHNVSDDDSDDDTDVDDLLEENGEATIINAIADNVPLPSFFLERLGKNENGPPNAWKSTAPRSNVRTPARNLIRTGLPAITATATALGNKPEKEEVWKLFFDQDIILKIVTNTNVKLASARQTLGRRTSKSNYRDTNATEIEALIGLLLLASVLKSNSEEMISLFSKDEYSRPIFRATMSGKRYEVLIACLRFDETQTREQRKETNKAAAISEIFDKIITNSQALYRPSEHVTVDEMLVPFRGRCSFRVYMPKKPKKYGIKVMCLADSKTSYLCNAYIYTGKGSDGVGLTEKERNFCSVPTQSLLRLCKVIEGSNRNVTADNWFSSTDGVEELEKKKLTYVGTLRKDKRAIPSEFLANKDRPVVSTLYGFRKDMTLLSFVPKKNKAVCLVSSMHNNIETNQDKNKPEIISFYNSTKSGVDLLDMKCALFSSSRKTRRWPLAVFYRLINIVSVNAFVVYMSYTGSPIMTRHKFIKSLGHDLIVPHLRRRLEEVDNLPRDLKMTINQILGNDHLPAVEGVPDDRLQKRKTCQKCPPGNDRKTNHQCIKCKNAICGQCTRRVCLQCAQEVV